MLLLNANGMAHVHSSFNNIIVTLTNMNGEVISGRQPVKKDSVVRRKNTPYAAQVASEECSKTAYDLGLRKVKVFVKGPGNGRESAIRAMSNYWHCRLLKLLM